MSLPNAFVTLLTTPSYLPGALVLLHSLHDLHPEPRDFKIVALVTPETVDAKTIGELRKAGYDLVIGVEPIGSGKAGQHGLTLMGRPDLNFALTKLHLFRLSPFFSTLIYLDADVLPLRPLSHLFTTTAPHVLSACPDTGWPDCFNSGVMVIRPRDADWEALRGMLKDGEGDDGIYRQDGGAPGNGSFDGADQGLLNEYFSEEGGGGEWNRLPFTYNVTPSAAYTWAPAYRRYGHKISNVHFIGPSKPWSSLSSRPAGVSNVQGKEATFDYPSLIDRWYAVYDKHVRPSAAHDPDVSRRFAVPETVAVWNQSLAATGYPAQLADRLNLDELRAASSRGVTSLKPGQYTSLPLEGRVDLLMPKPQLKPAAIPLPPSPTSTPPPLPASVPDPSSLASPPLESAPPPQSIHQQTEQPATWDAQHYAPPRGRPEMAIAHSYYANAWEASPAQQASYYVHPAQHHQTQEPQYPTLPDNVKQDAWYARFAGSTPDRTQVSAVFPWEKEGETRPRPGRVFPRGDSPPRHQPAHGQGHHRPPSISVQQATPEGRSPNPVPHGSPSPPAAYTPRSMEEAMASYTNAWDSVPQIGRYIKHISGKATGGSRDVRSYQAGRGLQSVPGTPGILGGAGGGGVFPARGGQPVKEKKGSEDSESSADGDDENSTSDDDPDATPLIPPATAGTLANHPGLPAPPPANASFAAGTYSGNAKYRDRYAQTESPPQVDEKVQAGPGGGASPALRTIALPSHGQGQGHVRRGSKQGGQVHVASGTVRRSSKDNSPPMSSPLPNYNFDFRGATQHAHELAQASSPTSYSAPGGGNGATRVWDPSTDVDVRRRDSQEVLSRFMKAASLGQGGGRQ
ncbi:hypothetical protein IAT38_007305 [Cryptococcus sp. DSM 104549]